MYQNQFPPELTNLLGQPVTFPLDRPPVMFDTDVVYPQTKNFFVQLISLIANEINSKANLNPARILLFNTAIQSNYNNPTFSGTFITAVELFELYVAGSPQVPPESHLQKAAVTATAYATLAMFSKPEYNQAIRSLAGPQFINDFNNVQISFNAEMSAVARFKQMNGRGNPQYQQPGGYQFPVQNGNQYNNQVYPQQGPYGQPMQNQSYPAFQHQQPTNGGSVFQGGHTNYNPVTNDSVPPANSRFAAGAAHTYNYAQKQNTPNDNPYGNKSYDPVQRYEDIKVEVRRQVQPVAVNENPIDEWDEVTRWVPSEEFPVPPAVNSKTQKMVSRTYSEYDASTGQTKTFTKTFVIARSKEEMDKDKHTISSVAQVITSHIPSSYTTREEYVNSVLSSGPVGKVVVKAPTTNETTESVHALDNVVSNNELVVKDNLSSAILNVRVGQKAQPVTKNNSFRTTYIITPSFVSRKSHEDVVLNLQKAVSLDDLAVRMTSFLSSEHCEETHQFIYDIDRFIARELVSFLNGKFAVGLKSMSCFMDDYRDINLFLTNKHSPLAADAFKKQEIKFINAIVRAVQIDGYYENGINAESDAEKDGVFLTSVENYYSIACVDILSSELNLTLHNPVCGNSSLVQQQTNPALFRFIQTMFKEAEEDSKSFAHHLLVTNDEKIYELHKSVIGYQENYMISIFNN